MANELILAVDDEAHILELLSFNLEAGGYRVVTAATGEDALFLGDGAPGFEAAIRERLGDKAHFVQPQHNGLRAGSACALAARRLEAGETPLDYITLLPLYLRAPQAERERAAREGAKHG